MIRTARNKQYRYKKETKNCPSCGAPISKGHASNVCEYCGSTLVKNTYNWVLAKKENKRIISVCTTSTRTLETIIKKYGCFKECAGNTEIFIYPGYQFKVIDGLITNFHLPQSTLVMLVAALCGRENILHAYEVAVQEKYRFFSFGDAMLIIDK